MDTQEINTNPQFPNLEILPKMSTKKEIAEKRIKQLHLTPGTIFMNRWSIEGMIGSGGYGQIFLAMDTKKNEVRAVKIEPKMRMEMITRRMIMEMDVMLKMQGKQHVPLVYSSGYNNEFNFIVMQLLSENIGDIRKRSPAGRLSKETVGRIVYQTVNALKDIHEMGYVHRDVKPANICFGCHQQVWSWENGRKMMSVASIRFGQASEFLRLPLLSYSTTPISQNRHILYLLDFGLLRRFKTDAGIRKPSRPNAGFKGTERYVSVRVHEKLEQTPWDDLFSVMYSAYELVVGEVPWRHLEDVEEIYAVKKLMNELNNNGEMFKDSASVLIDFHKMLVELDPSVDPPYEKLMNCAKVMYQPKELNDLYDWDEGFKLTLSDEKD
ncbi:hypothetical protein GCK72_008871 [Caenorhabditis remanei]|uniref:non-specific serine/threonine protein kinase n=1 Tax=Caenorhabditis remanei TaxID=31234 RepID=A0A6A5H2C3_CAERE|nr:hypothetical protein GCK72_008871 [Caenorhabditis remanei]KAF1760622.1 hypothetical protein GCK72_008871 [Caenorhabditis remanei]